MSTEPLKVATAPAQDSQSRISRARLQIDQAIALVSDPAELLQIAEGLEGAALFIRRAAGFAPPKDTPGRIYTTESQK